MYRTFNMGMGMCIIAPEEEAKGIIRTIGKSIESKLVGSVRKGRGISLPAKDIHFDSY